MASYNPKPGTKEARDKVKEELGILSLPELSEFLPGNADKKEFKADVKKKLNSPEFMASKEGKQFLRDAKKASKKLSKAKGGESGLAKASEGMTSTTKKEVDDVVKTVKKLQGKPPKMKDVKPVPKETFEADTGEDVKGLPKEKFDQEKPVSTIPKGMKSALGKKKRQETREADKKLAKDTAARKKKLAQSEWDDAVAADKLSTGDDSAQQAIIDKTTKKIPYNEATGVGEKLPTPAPRSMLGPQRGVPGKQDLAEIAGTAGEQVPYDSAIRRIQEREEDSGGGGSTLTEAQIRGQIEGAKQAGAAQQAVGDREKARLAEGEWAMGGDSTDAEINKQLAGVDPEKIREAAVKRAQTMEAEEAKGIDEKREMRKIENMTGQKVSDQLYGHGADDQTLNPMRFKEDKATGGGLMNLEQELGPRESDEFFDQGQFDANVKQGREAAGFDDPTGGFAAGAPSDEQIAAAGRGGTGIPSPEAYAMKAMGEKGNIGGPDSSWNVEKPVSHDDNGYPIYAEDSKSAKSFREAHAKANKDGNKNFMWAGGDGETREYNSNMATQKASEDFEKQSDATTDEAEQAELTANYNQQLEGLNKRDKALAKERSKQYYIDPISGYAINLKQLDKSIHRKQNMDMAALLPAAQRAQFLADKGVIDKGDVPKPTALETKQNKLIDLQIANAVAKGKEIDKKDPERLKKYDVLGKAITAGQPHLVAIMADDLGLKVNKSEVISAIAKRSKEDLKNTGAAEVYESNSGINLDKFIDMRKDIHDSLSDLGTYDKKTGLGTKGKRASVINDTGLFTWDQVQEAGHDGADPEVMKRIVEASMALTGGRGFPKDVGETEYKKWVSDWTEQLIMQKNYTPEGYGNTVEFLKGQRHRKSVQAELDADAALGDVSETLDQPEQKPGVEEITEPGAPEETTETSFKESIPGIAGGTKEEQEKKRSELYGKGKRGTKFWGTEKFRKAKVTDKSLPSWTDADISTESDKTSSRIKELIRMKKDLGPGSPGRKGAGKRSKRFNDIKSELTDLQRTLDYLNRVKEKRATAFN